MSRARPSSPKPASAEGQGHRFRHLRPGDDAPGGQGGQGAQSRRSSSSSGRAMPRRPTTCSRLGADDVIPEEFETSIEIFTRVLEKYHIPRNVVDAQVKVLRGECYGMLRGACSAVRPVAERIADLLASGTAETYFVGQGGWPAGQDARRPGSPRPDRRDRHRRRPRRRVLHRTWRRFRDPGTGHAGPRRQSPGHRPGLPGTSTTGASADTRGDRGMRAARPPWTLAVPSSPRAPPDRGRRPLGGELERRGLRRPAVPPLRLRSEPPYGSRPGRISTGLLNAADLAPIRAIPGDRRPCSRTGTCP
ncbi:MAG: hypothetical protein M0C28_27410 [Candidatus Moduliflexus flocculans]|nr:hypothetical protein [Candidatus Moduliflexus flocculans]